MGSWAIMALNAALAVGCCFVVARIVTAIGAEALEPVPTPTLARQATESDSPISTALPSTILDRNLFGAQLAGEVQIVEQKIEEPLTATKLPLRLLGTAAASEPGISRAAIEDEKTKKHMVVGVGDPLEGYARVRVDAIERTRVILDNAGRPEELALFEDRPRPPPPTRRTAARAARRASPRANRVNDRLQALAGADGQGLSRLLSQARIVPHYIDGEMMGMRIDAIQSDSLFERAGLENGDVIVEVNGIVIDRPESASAIFDELGSAEAIDIAALRGDAPINVSALADELMEQE